jgi:hypothetical protein
VPSASPALKPSPQREREIGSAYKGAFDDERPRLGVRPLLEAVPLQHRREVPDHLAAAAQHHPVGFRIERAIAGDRGVEQPAFLDQLADPAGGAERFARDRRDIMELQQRLVRDQRIAGELRGQLVMIWPNAS